MQRCTCGQYKRANESCETCRRRQWIAAIVAELTERWTFASTTVRYLDELDRCERNEFLGYLDALEGLAELLIERGKMIRAHRKELLDESRDAQRCARDAYDEGVFDGRESADAGGW